MLGSASEAEDVVQDAWLRAREDRDANVRSPRAYLTTIVTRLCIDHLRSAERTRMEYPGRWLPEPLAEPNQDSAPGLLMRHPISGNGTYSFDIADGRIRTIYVVRNPDKLRGFLERTH